MKWTSGFKDATRGFISGTVGAVRDLRPPSGTGAGLKKLFARSENYLHNKIGGKTEAEHQAEAANKARLEAIIGAGPPTPEQSEARAGPLLQAMQANYERQVPLVKRQTFVPFAERGFGSSGLAEQGIRQALASFAAQHETERQGAINDAYQQLASEQEQRAKAAQSELDAQNQRLYGR